jgi:hypothetical protein
MDWMERLWLAWRIARIRRLPDLRRSQAKANETEKIVDQKHVSAYQREALLW